MHPSDVFLGETIPSGLTMRHLWCGEGNRPQWPLPYQTLILPTLSIHFKGLSPVRTRFALVPGEAWTHC